MFLFVLQCPIDLDFRLSIVVNLRHCLVLVHFLVGSVRCFLFLKFVCSGAVMMLILDVGMVVAVSWQPARTNEHALAQEFLRFFCV